jgi:hypothetical protein
MAENVKRRVAAARLAVAFVAAGTIAGATAWAQASPPVAKSSAYDAFLKIKSQNIVDGSLLYQDFKQNQVPSQSQFAKFHAKFDSFQKAVFKKYLTKTEAENTYIKGESNTYMKMNDADARYLKLSEPVVRGTGSVFTASGESLAAKPPVRLLDVPNAFTVDAQGPTITITNTSGSPFEVSKCSAPGGGTNGGGTLQPQGTLTCDGSSGIAQAVQLIGAGPGGGPQVATLNFSSFSTQNGSQDTVQILVGL